jgi:LacI family transcriptional regulator
MQDEPMAVIRSERVTLNEVSALAGVSRSTASLVLRGSSKIPEVTRVRVLEAMSQLGYVYNRQAANMRQSQSMTIGLVATDIRNPYFAELTMAVEESVHKAGYTLFMGYSRDSISRQGELLDAMLQRQVDGILLLPAIGSTVDNVGAVASRSGAPLVQIARYFSDEFDYVGPDNQAAAQSLAEHIASLGGTTAVLIGGPEGSSARRERMVGLERGFEGTPTRFDPAESVSTVNDSDDGSRGTFTVLERGSIPDVIIAYSDAVAQGVYAELRRRNLEPGISVAVASFDDVPLAALQVPPMTSVATHATLVGQKASEVLLQKLRDPSLPATHTVIEPTLKVRASTALWRPRVVPVQS